MFCVKSGQNRVVGYSLKHPPQTVFLHTESKPLLQNICFLLKHKYLQTIAYTFTEPISFYE